MEYERKPRADLRGADLQGADLTGADLTGAILKNILYDPNTKYAKDGLFAKYIENINDIIDLR